MNFLKLIRWKNLLFIVFIMYVMRYCIIERILHIYGLFLLLPGWKFALLVFMTVLMAAAGYMINDYFDVETDVRNKKENLIVQGVFSKNFVFYTHLIFNLIAIVIGFYLSAKIGFYKIGILYVLIAGLLWFYSSSYKNQFFIGNLIIATLAALVPFLPALYEIPLQNQVNYDFLVNNNLNLNLAIYWSVAYAVFAFLMTLVREIVKDMEDAEGDLSVEARTMPIVLGNKAVKFIVLFLILVILGAIGYVYHFYLRDWLSAVYLLAVVVLPLIYFLVKLFKAKEKKDYGFLSKLLKIIMFTGVSYAFVACYIFSLA